ncbi:FAD-binding oxidoreductase [Naumannella sp. ID2617S]|nr:FAD-binding oxidoreductase [Naumannella sp. ID2617S]
MAQQVTIIGAGITGLTLGLLATRAGLPVTVVDPGLRLGERDGLMGAPAGLQQELQYHHVERWWGDAGLQAYAEQVRRGQQLVLACAADCGVPVTRAEQATLTADGREAFWLRHEVVAMRQAGLQPVFTDETGLPFSTRPQLVLPDQPVLDLIAYRDALAAALTEAGGVITTTGASPDGWTVSTTPEPVFDRALIRPRLRRADWSWVELASADPAAFPLRSGTDLDDGGRIWARRGDRLWLGSRRQDSRAQAARWFPEAEVIASWSAPAAASLDSLPLVGYAGSPADKRLVATGFDAWELTLGSAAALQLVDVLTGKGRVDLPWSPVRLARPLSVLRAGWSTARHALRVSPVSPFPRRG